MARFRGFIAVDLETNEKITKILRELKTTLPSLKIVDQTNMHITLKFLGDTDDSQIPSIMEIIQKATEGMRPFTISLVGTGAFPSKSKIRVIWIGIKDAGQLAVIAKKIDEELHSLEFEKEKREFSPHLTLARTKEVTSSTKIEKLIDKYSKEEFGEEVVRSIRLKKSVLTPKGPIYSTIDEVNLA
ncbi:MAG: RNA 2',3'-cyclic phosphodiesterase [Methanomassiliicoccales archaeon]|jgi:2'-5' RNA ligase|nr:RNA 2',3'-cyclic phosphodiesterase [Methanomassiliicoccales archaeon]